jgi:HD-GYP domain-containing protein (c-di-GMP phosphodiesterase class II)
VGRLASNRLVGLPANWINAYHIMMLARYIIVGELEKAYDDTIEALGSALGLKDEETEAHSKRVTAYTISIAKSVRVPFECLSVLARAAFLHDIGKMAIPDKILRKPGPLDDQKNGSGVPIVRLATTCSPESRSA